MAEQLHLLWVAQNYIFFSGVCQALSECMTNALNQGGVVTALIPGCIYVCIDTRYTKCTTEPHIHATAYMRVWVRIYVSI